MKPRRIIESLTTPEGSELVLVERDRSHSIEIDGEVLMSDRNSHSEATLATAVVSRIRATDSPRLMIGGLGMGFTLRAALDVLGPRSHAEIDVVEIFAAVEGWNRGILAPLAGRPLEDPRVRVLIGDVSRTIRGSRELYDAIMLDVDNGPDAFTLDSNDGLYSPTGLTHLHRALKPGGVAGVWSATDDRPFRQAMERAGFRLEVLNTRARPGGKGQRHAIFLGRRRE